MKKLVAGLVCLCLTFSLVACGEKDVDKSQVTKPSVSGEVAGPESAESESSASTAEPTQSLESAESSSASTNITEIDRENTLVSPNTSSGLVQEEAYTLSDVPLLIDGAKAKELPDFDGVSVRKIPDKDCISVSYIRSDASSVEVFIGRDPTDIDALKDMQSFSQETEQLAGVSVTYGFSEELYYYATWESSGVTYIAEDPMGMPKADMATFVEAFIS